MGTGHSEPDCRKCGTKMVRGHAIANTYVTGMPDFAGDLRGVTLNYGGPGKLIPVHKCPKCGHSISKVEE